jgi:predicted Fe-Mo cluster-binding NifX family protein
VAAKREMDAFDGLAAPARRALARAGYTTLAQLSKAGVAEVAALHGMGPNAIALLRRKLAAAGLAFKKG